MLACYEYRYWYWGYIGTVIHPAAATRVGHSLSARENDTCARRQPPAPAARASMSRAVRDTGRHVLLVARWRHLHAGAAALGAAAATATSAPTMCRPAEGGRARALDTCAQQLLPSFLLGAAIVACAKHNASRQLAATFSSVLDQHGGCGYEYPKLQLTPGHRSVRFCRLQKWYGEGGTGTGFHALASRRPAQPNDGASGTSSDRTARPQAAAVPTTTVSDVFATQLLTTAAAVPTETSMQSLRARVLTHT